MRQSDETPNLDSQPAQSLPLAPGAILRTGNGIPDQTADRENSPCGLDAGTPTLPTLPAQGDRDGAPDREQARDTSNTLPSPLACDVGPLGGSGGVPSLPDILDAGQATGRGRTRGTRLLEKAIKEQWPIPDRLVSQAVDYLASVLSDRNEKATARIKAVNGLLGMRQQNLAVMRTALESEREVSAAPSVTVNVNVDASGPLARIKRLQGESGGEGGDGPPVG